MVSMLKVTVDGVLKEYPEKTTYLDISKEVQEQYDHDIILGMKNGVKLMELKKKIKGGEEISFITTSDVPGNQTYIRGVKFMMVKAIYQVLGKRNVEDVFIKFSIGNGFYCELTGKSQMSAEQLAKVKETMLSYVEQDIPFWKRSLDTPEAIATFAKHNMKSKERLFQYRRVSKVNVYHLEDFEDYYYGYMPPSTGMLKYFDLQMYADGFVLVVPNRKTPNVVDAFVPQPKLFDTLKQSNTWGKMLEIDTIGALNDAVANGKIRDLILVQEALQEKKIAQIAQQIADDGAKKFIMIAGPSSSGKTSFSHRLSIQLRTLGLKPHPIAVDDYFVNREDTPLDENGNYNFECLEAIHVELFNKDMNALLRGERVELPTFNFLTGQREYRGNFKQLGPEDILVIEGIHGLNDKLSYSLPEESKFKIYISALTQINIDEHNRIPTTDGRLIRRIIRDARTRGASAAHTVGMWQSVRRGEDEHIFPFQEKADVMFNSALIYEMAVLKQYAEPLLFSIPKNAKEYVEAKRLLKFLDYFVGVNADEIPTNSILREFVGGSIFHV